MWSSQNYQCKKHSKLNKICTISIQFNQLENTVIKHQLPVNNYTNIISNRKYIRYCNSLVSVGDHILRVKIEPFNTTVIQSNVTFIY